MNSAILAYFRSLVDGSADPFFPHLVLICVNVLAAVAVGAGIIFEAPKYSSEIHRIATRLVIAGVFFEALSSIFLFAFDEGISSAQQSKIIALETRLAPRILTTEQFEGFKKLSGKVKAVSYMASPQVETAMFGSQLAAALDAVGVAITPYFSRPGDTFIGIRICSPANDPSAALLTSVLKEATGDDPGKCSFEEFGRPAIRTDIPLIIVGERPPFSPDGKPLAFRSRAYPGMEKNTQIP